MPRTFSFNAVLLSSLLFAAGCGSDSSAPESTAQVQPTSPATPAAPSGTTEEMPAEMGMEMGMNEGDPGMAMDPAMMGTMPGAGPGANPGAPVVPPRPENPADWTSQHITSALEERDYKVLEALPFYAEQRRGDDAAAQEVVVWMAVLMDPPKEPPKQVQPGNSAAMLGEAEAYATEMMEAEMMGPEMMEGMGNPNPKKDKSPEQLAEALIDTLLSLQTLTSFQAARELLAGQIPIPLDQEQVARQTLTSLIQNAQGRFDPAVKILKQALLQPTSIQKGTEEFDSQKLQKVTSEEHWKNAMALIDGLMGLPTIEEKPNRPQGGSFDESMMMMEPGGMLGQPESPQAAQNQADSNSINPIPPKFSVQNFSPEKAMEAREYLWSEEIVGELTERIAENNDLLNEPATFMLAGQIPATTSRQALKTFLENNWNSSDELSRNPAGLVGLNVFKEYMRDPGLLISLKELPREQMRTNQAGQFEEGSFQQPRAAVDAESLSKGLWYQASEQFMLLWLDKMHQAASQHTLPEVNLDELDLRLHRGAAMTLSARLLLDRGVRSNNPEVELFDKTTVNYVRIESPQMDDRTVKHYRTVLKSEDVYPILNNNGMWMSSSGRDRSTNELYSVDVLLSRNNARKSLLPPDQNQNGFGFNEGFANPGEGAGVGGGQMFVVEILVIRIPDPEVFLVPEEEQEPQVSSRN